MRARCLCSPISPCSTSPCSSIAWRRGWTWLAAAAVALSFVWTGYLLTRPPDDALAAGLFVILLALAASLVRPGEGRQLSLIQPLALGIVQLAIAGRADRSRRARPGRLFGALSAAAIALALLRPEYRPAPPLALGLALVLLARQGGDRAGSAGAVRRRSGSPCCSAAAGWRWRSGAAALLWTGIACARPRRAGC